jgi:hypothetical protein
MSITVIIMKEYFEKTYVMRFKYSDIIVLHIRKYNLYATYWTKPWKYFSSHMIYKLWTTEFKRHQVQ